MSQYKHAEIGDTVYFWFAANATTGAAGDGATPLYDVRLAGAAANAAPTVSGTPTLLTHADYTDGLHEIAVDTTAWSAGEYAVFCTLTISTVNPAGFCGSFKLRTAGSAALKVDMVTIKGQAITCAAGVTIRADVGAAAAPGSGNGMLIGGSNAATTFSSLTVSGATTLTGSITGTNVSNDLRGISVNMIKDQSVTCSTGVTFNANVGTTQPVNFTGTGASALVKSDMVDVAGSAVSTSTAQIGVNVVQAAGTAWGSGAITAAAIATGAIDADSLATDAVSEIADGVWDEAIVGHLGAGSTGNALNAAGAAGDPWSTTLPGAYGAGTAGKIIGDNINAPIGTVDTVVDAIKVKTDYLPSATAGAAGGVFIAGSNAATTVSFTGNLSGSVGSVTGAVGSVTGLTASDVAAIKAKTDNLPSGIKKNTQLDNFEFLMTDSTGHAPSTGLTVTATRSIDGGAFAACANSVTEVANGIYKITLANTDLNGSIVTLRFTAAASDDRLITVKTNS
jgi:hypothetical protein